MSSDREPTSASSLHFLPRFSLRAMFTAFAIVAIVMVVANHFVRPKVEHRIAVGRVSSSGATLYFSANDYHNAYTDNQSSLWRDVAIIEIGTDRQAIVASHELSRMPETGHLLIGSAVTDQGLVAICDSASADSIETITFQHSRITRDGLSKLPQLRRLRGLLFSTCPLDAAAIAELRALANLEGINFVEEKPGATPNRFDESCFREIGQLTNVRNLNLGNIDVSDNAARGLWGMKQLKTLVFSKGHISDAAVSDLRAALSSTAIFVH